MKKILSKDKKDDKTTIEVPNPNQDNRRYSISFKNKFYNSKNNWKPNNEEQAKKDEILDSILRHELRNGFQRILGYLEILNEKKIPNPHRSRIKEIKQCTKELIELSNKIEELKKLKNQERYNEDLINVKQVLSKVITSQEKYAESKGIKINSDLKDLEILGGPCIKEAFLNIVENSIKHSKGDKILIKTQKINEKIKISIEDDGVGIPDEEKDKIFQKRYKNHSNGTGLGLFLVKEIIERHEGKIEVKDSKLGGVKFILYLKTKSNKK